MFAILNDKLINFHLKISSCYVRNDKIILFSRKTIERVFHYGGNSGKEKDQSCPDQRQCDRRG